MFVGAVAVLLTATGARADIGGPRPRPGGPAPGPAGFPATRAKVNIVYDEKATEDRLIVPLPLLLGGFNVGGGFAGGVGVGGGFGGGFAGAVGAAGNFGVGGGQANLGGVGGGVLGAPPGGIQGQPPKQPPGGEAPPPSAPPKQSSLPLSTMVIGLALTLSLSTGGLWAVRRKTKTPGGGMTPLVLLVAFLGVALAGSAVVWANGAPPFRRPPPQPVAQPMPPIPGLLPALKKLENVRVDIVPQGDTIRLILTKKHKELLQPTAKPQDPLPAPK